MIKSYCPDAQAGHLHGVSVIEKAFYPTDRMVLSYLYGFTAAVALLKAEHNKFATLCNPMATGPVVCCYFYPSMPGDVHPVHTSIKSQE